jgi:flagellar hook-basal body complex protein FliE
MTNGIGASFNALQARLAADAQAALAPQININGGGAPTGSPTGNSAAGIADGFKQVIQSVNEHDRVATEKMAAVDSGKSDDLVGAMLASQEASLSFSMLMHARNKIVGAMEDLIKLQI